MLFQLLIPSIKHDSSLQRKDSTLSLKYRRKIQLQRLLAMLFDLEFKQNF